MKKLSLCMIVRNEENNLDRCLGSIEKYVQEIIIVDTGSSDRTKDVALRHGAKVYDFNSQTNPDSFMRDDEKTEAPPPYTNDMMLADFGAARNYSFSKATGDYVLWLDADDTVDHAENIPSIVAELEQMPQPILAWFNYDYSFAGDKPNCQLWRERILSRGNGRWLSPIHEVHDNPPGTSTKFFKNISIRHHRDSNRPKQVAHRNYKVLKKQLREQRGEPDPRILFYLGNEAKYMNADESIGYYEKYLRLSGWDEERSVARLMLGNLHESTGDLEAAFKAYSSATVDFPTNPDAWFALGKLAYLKADHVRCCYCVEKGISLGNPESAIMFNPIDRKYTPHTYFNVALFKLGRVHDAIASCDAGLAIFPDDSNLKFNKRLYEDTIKANPKLAEQPQSQIASGKISFSTDVMADEPMLPKDISTMMALQVWKEFLKYDELVKAQQYLLSLPYFMEDNPQLEAAKKKTAELLAFLDTDEKTKAYYSTHKIDEAIPVDVEMPKDWSQAPRLTAVLLVLKDLPKQRILDLGCQDGWMSNRLAMLGHSVVGLDFSPGHLKIARDNATRLNLDATYIEGFISQVDTLITEQFDIVICTEVIEHVANTYNLLGNLFRLLKDSGKLLLSTPKGCWLDGKVFNYPNIGQIGNKWNEPREHIRAFSRNGLHKVLGDFFTVESCYEAPIPKSEVEGQATLFAVCSPPKNIATSLKLLDIVIWTGSAWEWWNPNSPYVEGTGGSELACIEMAKQFARQGHSVKVYNDCPHMEGLYEGVEYRHFGSAPKTIECDVFISSRQAWIVMTNQVNAKAKFLWIHDIHVGDPSADIHGSLLRFDRFLCLSNWHKDFVLKTYPWLDKSKVIVTRNGINLDRFSNPQREKKNKLIYTSSGNRGLALLLELFPRIKEKVPDVTLDVYYGFNLWRKIAAQYPTELLLIDALEKQVNNTPSVTMHGRTNQQGLAKAWLEAKVWAYPTMFTETSCISAMEAQAAGAVPVTTDLAALNETVQTGYKLAPVIDDTYKTMFVDHVVSLLTDETSRKLHVEAGVNYAATLSWESLAQEWYKMFLNTISEVEANPMHEYNSCA